MSNEKIIKLSTSKNIEHIALDSVRETRECKFKKWATYWAEYANSMYVKNSEVIRPMIDDYNLRRFSGACLLT